MYLGFVFKITNKINGKSYIGTTLDIEQRMVQIFIGRNGTPISKAIQEYGKDNFKVEILHTIVEHSNDKYDQVKKRLGDLAYKERLKHPDGYNYRRESRTIDREQIRMIAKHRYDEGVCKGKAVMMTDLNGNEIKRYPSMTLASKDTGISVTSISLCCSRDHTKCLWNSEKGLTFVVFHYI